MKKDVIFIGGVGAEHEFGGELSKNKLILKRLAEEGYDVKAIDTYGSHRNPLKIAGLPFIIMRYLYTPIIFSTSYRNIRLLSKIIRRINRRRKIIYWAIGGKIGRDLGNGIYSSKEFDVFDHIIVESPTMVKQLMENGVAHVEYMPNFKDNKLSQKSLTKQDDLADGLRCVFFSRVQPEKGVDIILDALEAAEKSGRKISVDFYGEIKPDYKDRFLNKIDKLSNARYCGFLNFFDGSGQKILSEYHLSLFPTFWHGEGFPGVIVDAFMAGVPVLASDWNFNPELITEGTGYICRSKDIGNFTSRLFEVYDNRVALSECFDRCVEEGQKYDVNNIITADYLNKLLFNGSRN